MIRGPVLLGKSVWIWRIVGGSKAHIGRKERALSIESGIKAESIYLVTLKDKKDDLEEDCLHSFRRGIVLWVSVGIGGI